MQEKKKPNEVKEPNEELHNSGDKAFKVAMKVKATALEFIEQFFPELCNHLDLSTFELDDTNYVAKDFEEFYSDVVYRTYLKKASSRTKKPVAVALLFEHKKTIRTYFLLFLQLLEYIILIWKDDLLNKRKPSLIIPIVVFQGKKGLTVKQLHDCFKGVPKELLSYIPNFSIHLTNVHDLPDEKILALDQKGLLRSLFLAYTYTEKKRTVTNILEETFKFFNHDPDRFDFFQFLFEFIAKEDYLSGEEVERLFEKYLSPKSKKEMQTTYQVWVQKGKVEGREEGMVEGMEKGMEKGIEKGIEKGMQTGQIKKARLVVLRGRWKGLSADYLADLSELLYTDVENLLKGYDQTYLVWQGKMNKDKVEYLSLNEVDYLLDLFNKNQN